MSPSTLIRVTSILHSLAFVPIWGLISCRVRELISTSMPIPKNVLEQINVVTHPSEVCLVQQVLRPVSNTSVLRP